MVMMVLLQSHHTLLLLGCGLLPVLQLASSH
jgi:hypothetical protein